MGITSTRALLCNPTQSDGCHSFSLCCYGKHSTLVSALLSPHCYCSLVCSYRTPNSILFLCHDLWAYFPLLSVLKAGLFHLSWHQWNRSFLPFSPNLLLLLLLPMLQFSFRTVKILYELCLSIFALWVHLLPPLTECEFAVGRSLIWVVIAKKSSGFHDEIFQWIYGGWVGSSKMLSEE